MSRIINFSKADKFELCDTFAKLKEIVEKKQSFEEESLLYTYEGEDKELIWSCMEIFYKNLYSNELNGFYYTDKNDDWENYNFQLQYNGKFSEVNIVYGIGSFCVIKPIKKPTNASNVFDLNKIEEINNETITYGG